MTLHGEWAMQSRRHHQYDDVDCYESKRHGMCDL
jgi:hypothetical protein